MNRRTWLSHAGLAFLVASTPLRASADDSLLTEILSTAGPTVRRVLAARATYERQILWTRLAVLDNDRFKVVSEHRLGVERKRWFTAASFVKLPLAALVFEALEERGLASRVDQLYLRVTNSCGALPAPLAGGWKLGDLLRSMLIASDNLAYNALYELVGSDLIHARLAALGYTDLRMPMRLGGCGSARKAAAVLSDEDGGVVWESPAVPTEKPQRFAYGRALKGRAWQQGARQIPGPHDFSASNFIALEDVQRIFMDLTGVAIPAKPFELSTETRNWLRQTLGAVPRDCLSPRYPEDKYPDNHGKYLLVGGKAQRLPPGIVIANKNALSYGYAGDCALITEPARKLAFVLSAVVYVNRDGVLNDGAYEYAEIGLPFLRELGEALLAFERSRLL